MSNQVFPSTLLGFDIKITREVLDSVRADESASRKEVTSTWSTYPRYRYQVDFNILRSDSIMASSVRDFEWQQFCTHIARHFGRLNSFLFTDPDDSSVTDHGFAVGDGVTTAFQLQRTMQGDIIDAYGEWAASSKPRANLLLRSSEIENAAWTKRASNTIVANQDTAPDGTATADWIFVSGVVNEQGFYQEVSTINGAFTGSISLRAISGVSTVQLTIKDRASDTIRGTATVTLTSAWQRVQVTGTTLGTNAGFRFEVGGQGTGTYAAWGAQVELVSAATPYIATVAAAVTVNPSYWPATADGFEPVFDLNGVATYTVEADGLGKRPLVQWGRTNLILRSQEFENAAWTIVANTSVSANATTAPDGTATADKLQESTITSAEHYVEQAIAIAASTPMAGVVYAQASQRSWLYVSVVLRDAATVRGAYFDLTNGVLGTVDAGVSATITPCGNGWFRCAIVRDVGTGGSSPRLRIELASANGTISYAGTVNSGLFLWGASGEQAFQAGDYIATTAATASRTDITVTSGVVTAAVAPRTAAVLAWTGSFYRRCRFDMDAFGTTRLFQSMYEAKSVQLLSVK